MRTIVDLPEVQIKALAELCRKKGISRAEAVRRALAGMLASQSGNDREKAFGAWGKKKMDGLKFVKKIRGEWEV